MRAAEPRGSIAYLNLEGRAAPFERQGERACLVLDPEDRDVSVFRAFGAPAPGKVYCRRAVSIGLPSSADLEHVEEILRAHEAEIEAVFALYAGAGAWTGDGDDLNALLAALEMHVSQARRGGTQLEKGATDGNA